MIRLFVALDLPEALRQRLAALGGGLRGARWVAAENMHLTLRFIGEIEEGLAEEVAEALAAVTAPAFSFRLSGIGVFATGRHPHTLYVGVEKAPGLALLQGRIESALVHLGLEPERRKFTPHLTLARLKDAAPEKVRDFVAGNALFQAGPVAVDRFVLYSSRLGGQGPLYEAEADYPLAGAS